MRAGEAHKDDVMALGDRTRSSDVTGEVALGEGTVYFLPQPQRHPSPVPCPPKAAACFALWVALWSRISASDFDAVSRLACSLKRLKASEYFAGGR